MMRRLNAILLTSLLLFPLCTQAQQKLPEGVEIEKFWWGQNFAQAYYRAFKVDFNLRLKNTGSKTIIAVIWEVEVYDRFDDGRVHRRWSFPQERLKIKPGGTKKLKRAMVFVDDRDNSDRYTARVSVLKVVRDDGTVWNPSAEKVGESGRKPESN